MRDEGPASSCPRCCSVSIPALSVFNQEKLIAMLRSCCSQHAPRDAARREPICSSRRPRPRLCHISSLAKQERIHEPETLMTMLWLALPGCPTMTRLRLRDDDELCVENDVEGSAGSPFL